MTSNAPTDRTRSLADLGLPPEADETAIRRAIADRIARTGPPTDEEQRTYRSLVSGVQIEIQAIQDTVESPFWIDFQFTTFRDAYWRLPVGERQRQYAEVWTNAAIYPNLLQELHPLQFHLNLDVSPYHQSAGGHDPFIELLCEFAISADKRLAWLISNQLRILRASPTEWASHRTRAEQILREEPLLYALSPSFIDALLNEPIPAISEIPQPTYVYDEKYQTRRSMILLGIGLLIGVFYWIGVDSENRRKEFQQTNHIRKVNLPDGVTQDGIQSLADVLIQSRVVELQNPTPAKKKNVENHEMIDHNEPD